MGRPAAPRATGRAEAGTRRRGLVHRLLLACAAVAAAITIAVLPGSSQDSGTQVERMLEAAASSEQQRPTLETVQGLAAALSNASVDQPIDPDRVASVVTQPGEYEALGRLTIPAIGLDVEIGNGVDPLTLARGPGHWTGTPLPGQLGNAVFSGHRTTHTAPFRELDELAPGDEITVTTLAGAATSYAVTEVLVVPVEDYTSEVLAQPSDAQARELTLFACHPEGSLTHRIVVHARVLAP